jgi:hypothetical protein
MGCKYVKEFDFGAAVKPKGAGFAKGGKVDPEVREAVHRHERNMHPKEPLTPMKKGGCVGKGYAKGGIIEKGTGEKYASKAAMMRHEKKETKAEEAKEHAMKKGGYASKKAMVKQEMMETPRMRRDEMVQKRVVRGPAMAAGRDPRAPMLPPSASSVAPPAYGKGGNVKAKVGKVMKEFGKGELHSGSKKGPIVTNPKQAVAIGYSEARKKGK